MAWILSVNCFGTSSLLPSSHSDYEEKKYLPYRGGGGGSESGPSQPPSLPPSRPRPRHYPGVEPEPSEEEAGGGGGGGRGEKKARKPRETLEGESSLSSPLSVCSDLTQILGSSFRPCIII